MQMTPRIIKIRAKKPLEKPWAMRALFGLILLASLLGRSAAAQGIQQFVGHVEDSTGAVIPGAAVTIHNEGTGIDINVTTTGAGDYTAPYLKPGTYTITAKMAGFKEISKTHVHLDVDQTSKMDFALPAGDVSETVTVSSEGTSQIELAKADRGEIIENERIQEMPSNGRQILDLFALSPGAIQANNPQYTRQQDNVSQNLQANGVTINAVAENIDGVTNDNAGNYMGYNPPLDSVGSFKVVLNAYDASFGRSAGAAIDVSLKSGSNNPHGDLYYFGRKPFLDTNLWSADYSLALYQQNPVGQPPVNVKHNRDQFGAELDGPLSIPHLYNGKDKTFFLIQWEQSYESAPSSSPTISSVPNPAWLTGNFSGATYYDGTTHSIMPLTIYDPLSPLVSFVDIDGKTKFGHIPFPGNVIPLTCTPIPPATACSHLDPVGQAIAQYYLQVPVNSTPGAGYAPYQNNLSHIQVQTFVTRNGTIKLDQNFGAHDRAALRWGGYEAYNVTNPNGVLGSNPANQITSQVQPAELQFSLEEIHTFSPNLILDNKAILSTYKQGLAFGARGNFLGALGFSQHLINNEVTPNIFPYIQANSNLGGNSFVNLGNAQPQRRNISHEVAYAPSLTYVHGHHTFRGGVDLRLLQYTTTAPPVAQNTQFSFTSGWTSQLSGTTYSAAPGITSGLSIASLLVGDPNGGGTAQPNAPFYSQHYVAPWVQDDWKVTPKLTLNIGVRYDLLGARTERHNQLDRAFNTTASSPINAQLTTTTGLNGPLLGGTTFAGLNGQPRGAYSMNLLNIQPRFGAAYAFSSRTSLRAGFGEFFVSDESVNPTTGFSSSTSYTNSLDGGVTPYGHLADPFPAFVSPLGSSQGLATGAGGSISFVNPNLVIPSVWVSSVSVEQQLTRRDILDISYSSSRAYNLPGSDDLNHVSAAYNAQCDVERGAPNGARTKYCDGAVAPAKLPSPFYNVAAFSGTSYSTTPLISAGAFTRPFPQFQAITENNLPLVHSWYNSMQIAASHNASKDLTFHFGLTWAKNMQAGNIIDTVNRIYGRNLMSNDIPIAITLSGVYYLPVGRGRTFLGHTNRLVDAAVGGWEIAPYYVYNQGVPFSWSPGTGTNNNFHVLSSLNVKQHDLPIDGAHTYKRLQGVTPCVGYEDPDTGLINAGPSYTAAGCTSYAVVRSASAYSVAQNIVYTGVRLPNNHQFDASASKRFAYNEHINLQLRIDAFNLLNHPNWSQVGGTGANNFGTDPTKDSWGTITKGPTGPENFSRELQLSGKINF
jgi:hypothetical protein